MLDDIAMNWPASISSCIRSPNDPASRARCYLVVGTIWFTILFLASRAVLTWRRRKVQFSHGCAIPKALPVESNALFGIGKLQKSASHIKRGSYLELSEQRFKDAQCLTYRSTALGQTIIDTCDPKNIQAVLALNFRDWSLGEDRRRAFSPLLGNGIFAADGAEWHSSRVALRPSFTGDHLTKVKNFEKHFQKLLEVINHSPESLDLSELFFGFTLDLATEVFFGKSYDSLETEKSPERGETRSSIFAQAFNKCQRVMADNLVMGRLGPLVAGSEGRKQFQHDCDVVLSFVEDAVNDAMQDLQANQGETDRFVFLHDLLAKGHDPTDVKYELVNILVAGRDTTASLLSDLWFMLARRADIYTNLRGEVVEKLGSDKMVPSLQDLNDMPYLHACVNEALRLFPPVPVNSRTAIRDTILPTGGGESGQDPIFVAEGTRVGYNVWAMHRSEEVWGEDAADFKPERWIDDKGCKRQTGWEFLPFNGGPRICLGQKLALTEARFVTCRLVQHFAQVRAEAENTPVQTPRASRRQSENMSGTDTGKLDSSGQDAPACTWGWKESLTLTCTSADGTWVSLMR